MDGHASTVMAKSRSQQGAFAIADDVRPTSAHGGRGKYRVVPTSGRAGTVMANSSTGQGAYAIADEATHVGRTSPRFNNVYRVVASDEPCVSITGSGAGAPSAGAATVADPTVDTGAPAPLPWSLDWRPKAGDAPVIESEWGFWHRPLTPLELAALQGFPVAELQTAPMPGRSTHWRRMIGNAVPVLAAKAIMEEFMTSFLLALAGETQQLRMGSVWVQPGEADPLADLRLATRSALSMPVIANA
jgi:site-specific DNA-cytosine methylase